ncbi:MAG: hypothetical protein ACOVOI_23930 [Hyphomicrobiales bacterium]
MAVFADLFHRCRLAEASHVGVLACAFFAGPWTGRDIIQYQIAGVLIALGAMLWVVTVLVTRATAPEGALAVDGDGPVRIGPKN